MLNIDEFLDEPISSTSTGQQIDTIDCTLRTDPRLYNLSYSSLLTAHSCPRKFQLQKQNPKSEPELNSIPAITLDFGKVVGQGVQDIMVGKSLDSVMLSTALLWTQDYLAEDTKGKKSLWHALAAIQRFAAMRSSGFLEDYEVLEYNGVPAAELGFCITFPSDSPDIPAYKYRGFVDLVLRHKHTGKILVLELKTTKASAINPAQYKNSAQALGYSIVLDAIVPEASSYQVLYLIYQTTKLDYEFMQFEKSYFKRALWIRKLLLDIEVLDLYNRAEIYPMRGESCYTFFRECEFFGLCELSDEYITKPLTTTDMDKLNSEEFLVNLTIQDLIDAQLTKEEIS